MKRRSALGRPPARAGEGRARVGEALVRAAGAPAPQARAARDGAPRSWTPATRGALAAAALALAAAPAGCLKVAEGRAELDREVGRAEASGVRFEVEGGLAAVRSVGNGTLSLWAGAPAFTLRASGGAGGRWRLAVENAMPDLVLDARLADGTPLPATAEPAGAVPTERAWTFDLPANASAALALAPPDAADASPYRFAVFA
ncbi:MAG TPA: hypothetical protein VFS00_24610, partial [Polyangiaceae bacterium]|nr:hypothetical protein [Polyangiaceae bacterium]